MWDCLPYNFTLSFWSKSIVFPVLVSSFVHMEAKAKLDVEYLEIYPTLLQNPENLIKPAWISNPGRQFSEWDIVFLYFPKSQVKIKYFLFVSTHVNSSYFIDSANAVAFSMFTGEYGNYSTLCNLFVCSRPSSSVQENLTVPIPFGIISITPIVSNVFRKIVWQNWHCCGSYHIHISVFLTPLRIFAPCLEILFFINNYFLVGLFKYITSSRVNSGLEI